MTGISAFESSQATTEESTPPLMATATRGLTASLRRR